jgi:hypothetical protein
MGTVYPVGSLYFGTQSTCPLAAIINGSTWEKVGSSLITSVNTSVPVIGNGKAIGLTDGLNGYGLQGGSGGGEFLSAAAGNYGKNINTPNVTPRYIGNKTLGLTENPENSGIVGTVTRTALTVNIWKRTA